MPDAPDDFALEMLCATANIENLSPHRPIAPLRHGARPMPSELRMQYEEPGQEREEDWRRSLHSLQECICELLIRNQELRMLLLDSANNRKSGETDQ